ncbi:hypothetical protein ACIQ9J_35890, partial [Streptomyces sp. NPDC094153]|uniref:hypothetical protein n=1 Tax=Streptomyces sp. NPDC094153 TaxID=3366058 RepID=UPI0038136E42
MSARIPRLERVYIHGVHFPATRRVRDPANWDPNFKAAIDGPTDKKREGQVLAVGVLSDDSDEHVVGPDTRLGDVVTRPHITMLIWDLTRQAGSAAGEAADARWPPTPSCLHLQAFGPFAGRHSIDFDALTTDWLSSANAPTTTHSSATATTVPSRRRPHRRSRPQPRPGRRHQRPHGVEAVASAPEVPLPPNSVSVRSGATVLDVYAPGHLGELTEIIDPELDVISFGPVGCWS